jgi:2-oxoglutarate/2-oxoacid ferredoxin oxidoreductase subunit alpha
VKCGSHGDYEPIALSPNSPQECFDLMIKAFNLAELYRVPVFFMMDEVVGHMTERVVIPEASALEVVERAFTSKPPGEYKAYATNGSMVPEMVKAGDGYRIHITGLTHDERGYPAMNPPAQHKMMERLLGKIRQNRDQLIEVQADHVEDADVVVVSFGITSRVAGPAIEEARRRGLKVGHLRLIITWPFPASVIQKLARRAKAFVVPELNMGQMVLEVERAVAGRAAVISVPHAGGTVHEPQEILARILEAASASSSH